MSSNRPRQSLQQLQAEARGASGADPWACRSCGCRLWSVKDSRLAGAGPRKRERVCENCGEPMTTQELPVPPGHKLAVVPDEEEECEAA